MQNRVLALALAVVLLGIALLLLWGRFGPQQGRGHALVLEGEARLSGSESPEVTLSAGDAAVDTKRVANPLPELDSTIQPPAQRYGSVLGRVREAGSTGVLIRSGIVTLRDPRVPESGSYRVVNEWFRTEPIPGLPWEAPGESPATVTIDSVGGFNYRGLKLGTWVLRVQVEGYEVEEKSFVLDREEPPLELVVELTPPTRMDVVLRGEGGGPLTSGITDDQRRVFEALQPVFVEHCPAVGLPLPGDVRRLAQKSRNVTKDGLDAWMQVKFASPKNGCACVVFADRVLAAVPFAAGQSVVVLTVRKADLDPGRGFLTVVVQDEVSREPIVGAAVRIRGADYVEHTGKTDEHGTCRFGSLLVGETSVQVSASGHESRTERRSIVAGDANEPLSILLNPQWALSGRVRLPASGTLSYAILVYRADDPGRSRNTVTTTSSRTETFTLSPLPPALYLVGVSVPGLGQPDVDHVRRGSVPGWTWVDLRQGPRATLELEITEEMAAKMRAGPNLPAIR